MIPALIALILAAPAADAGPQDVLDTWLKAQNTADFELYHPLFATKFQGVKRSGNRVYRFDRAGWLADRKRMFSPKVKVEISDLSSRALTKNMTAFTFTQKWSSGKYEDVGTKRITLFKEATGWRIAREDMLTSDVKRDQTAGGVLTPNQFAPVVGGRVLLRKVGEGEAIADLSQLAEGKLDLGQLTWAPTLPDALSAADQAWIGRKLRVYGADGKACEATVERLVVEAPVWPHFGFDQAFEGEPAAARIGALWGQSPSDHRLAGELSGCADGLWARAADLPAAIPWTERPAPKIAQEARWRFKRLSGYQKLQKAHVAGGGKGQWTDLEDVTVTTSVFVSKDAEKLVTIYTQGNYCDGYGGEQQAVWRVGKKRLLLRTDPEGGLGDHQVVAVAQLGPGEPPLLLVKEGLAGGYKVARRRGDHYEIEVDFGTPYQDCPC